MAEKMKDQRASSAKETMDILMEMSKILNTGLDMETLATCVRLLESGVNPEALALVFNELKKESAAIQDLNDKRRLQKIQDNKSASRRSQNESHGPS